MKLNITLTHAQSEIWNWAQDTARDFWEDDYARDDGLHFDECPVGEAMNGQAVIEECSYVIGDMIDRMECLVDISCDQGGIDSQGHADKERMRALRNIPVANRVAAKLEAVLPA